MTEQIYVGFDFSMNKPAATIYWNNRYFFYFWPLDLQDKKVKMYKDVEVVVHARNIKSIVEKDIESSKLVLIHTIRSIDLANMIIKDLDALIIDTLKIEDYELYVCSEGLSFGSKGDATLNLATYKGVLLAKIYEHYGDNLKRLYTYAPITLKSTAGCAGKETIKLKTAMIQAFIKERNNIPFRVALEKGKLKAKVNYLTGVDDLVDSYWALQTMVKKENLKM